MTRDITCNARVSIQEPRAAQTRIPVIEYQLDVLAVLLDVVGIIDAVEAGADIDNFDAAVFCDMLGSRGNLKD
jgi:hypothetical protein